jgi:hypothetical protein
MAATLLRGHRRDETPAAGGGGSGEPVSRTEPSADGQAADVLLDEEPDDELLELLDEPLSEDLLSEVELLDAGALLEDDPRLSVR